MLLIYLKFIDILRVLQLFMGYHNGWKWYFSSKTYQPQILISVVGSVLSWVMNHRRDGDLISEFQ
jgi:hypothetical protein